METDHGNPPLLPRVGLPFDGLARSVISKISTSQNLKPDRRIEVGTKVLLSAVLDRQSFDQDRLLENLKALRVSDTDMVDLCIPGVATRLGEGWLDDSLAFASVTTASARLLGLFRTVGNEWDNVRPPLNSRSVLLVTMKQEDHIIGPAVLADQFRRRGHSVKLHLNATAESILEHLDRQPYDGILISSASLLTLETAVQAIKSLRKAQRFRIPIILGGAVLNVAKKQADQSGADVVTNSIGTALDALVCNDIEMRVAE